MVKMAIIGYGGMANWHFDNIRKKLPQIQVVGAYDIREEARERVKSLGMKAYENPGELYADKETELVLVSTPNNFHADYSIAAMEAGKNVICEKPVTINAAELERVIAASKRTGKLFTVHQNRRWDADFLTLRRILDEGILKNPYTIETRVQGSRQGMHGWRGHELNGGGMVFDWGVHLIDQILFMFPDKVVSVAAHLHKIYTPDVDDNFDALIRFESGLSVLINVAMNCFILQPRWHMCCEDGTAVIENWEQDGKIVKLSDDAGAMNWEEEIVYTAAGPTRSMAPRPKHTTKEIPLPKVTSDWTDLYKNVLAAIAGEEELIVKPEQSLRVMKVIDAIFESDRTGQSLKVEI